MKQTQPTPARICALRILTEVDRKKIRVSDVLHRELDKIAPAERALATHLVMGVLRLRGQLDWLWEAHSNRSRARVNPLINNILRLGVYQLFFCDGIAPYAAVNESVLLARRFKYAHAAAFVNAVLRNLSNTPVCLPIPKPTPADSLSRLANLLSHPEWLLKRWIGRFGLDETADLCRFNNAEPKHFIRINTAQIMPEKLIPFLRTKGWNPLQVPGFPVAVQISPTGNPTSDSGHKNGWYEIQSLPSMLISHLTNPKPGDLVLDACAGRGGKSMHLAQLMEGKGTVIAGDVRPAKLRLLSENRSRLKVEIVRPMGYNGVKMAFLRKFDRILLDAPCSSLGVVGRYPDIKWSRKEKDILNARRLQKMLLAKLADCVKPGGILVYAVCSFEPEETQEVIDGFLSQNSQFEREDVRDYIPGPFRQSVTPQGYWFPQHSATDGFFCARLRKSG